MSSQGALPHAASSRFQNTRLKAIWFGVSGDQGGGRTPNPLTGPTGSVAGRKKSTTGPIVDCPETRAVSCLAALNRPVETNGPGSQFSSSVRKGAAWNSCGASGG